jgi:hypothetical protein
MLPADHGEALLMARHAATLRDAWLMPPPNAAD